MRAVSSPSLTDNLMEASKGEKKSRNDENRPPANNNSHNHNNNNNYHQPPSASVLQKFKKTFSNLKGKSSSTTTTTAAAAAAATVDRHTNQATTHSTAPVNNGNSNIAVTSGDSDVTKYRFGPLVWRSSKERRKTKHHRRDKCNSGDSGIHVELENDENNVGIDVTDGMDTSPSFNVRVRRANSAKVTSSTLASTLKARAMRKTEWLGRQYSPLPSRSLSQPFGLNQGKLRFYISVGINHDSTQKQKKREENCVLKWSFFVFLLLFTDDDDSDTDSESIIMEAVNANQTVYAEVLYNFKAVGAEELSLERGALVEVLRIESGPWWWGRIKHDAILTSQNSQQSEGWFPKDFVRVSFNARSQHHHSIRISVTQY